MSQSPKTNLTARPGFSLLELVIVLAILAAVTAIAWPRLAPMLRRSSHQAAALRLKADLAEAREQAVHNGEVWELRAVLGTGRYVLGPAQTEQDVNRSEQEGLPHHELPDEVVFSQQRPSRHGNYARQSADESSRRTRSDQRGNSDNRRHDNSEYLTEESRSPTTSATTTSETNETRLAQFFPDGRVTETVIELVRPETHKRVAVRLRGLTGGITIGSAESTAEPSDSFAEDVLPAEEPNR